MLPSRTKNYAWAVAMHKELFLASLAHVVISSGNEAFRPRVPAQREFPGIRAMPVRPMGRAWLAG